MSWHLLSKDRSCFCCEPALPPTAYSQEMLNQQLQGWNASSSSRSSTEPFVVHSLNAPTEGAELSLCQQDDSRQRISQLDWNNLSGNGISSVNHQFELCQGQDSGKIFPSVIHSTVGDDLSGQSPSWNCHNLQNQELGDKMSRVVISESKDSPSISDFRKSGEYMLDGACGKTFVSASSTNHSDGMDFDGACGKAAVAASSTNNSDMDLDGALDELGTLSIVTNSRRQYLLETRGQKSVSNIQQRLHSKSKSSPNLTALGHPNGYRILQINKNFVTSLIDTLPFPAPSSSDQSPRKSETSQFGCTNPNILEDISDCHRFDPHLQRRHRYRYMYRLSRSPYKVPRRMRNSFLECNFVSDYYSSGDNSLKPSSLSSSTPSLEPSSDTQGAELTGSQQSSRSKSNTASPVKPNVEMRLTRSLSAEDLTSVSRRLEQEMKIKCRDSSSTDQSLDIMTSQMTDLHMS